MQIANDTQSLQATYDNQDRLLTFGPLQLDYNQHGELSSKLNTQTGQASTYEYTSLGQLRRVVTPSGTIEYIFDGENKRIGRRFNGNVTHYWTYDSSGRLNAELNADGTLKSRFIYGTQDHSPDYVIVNGVSYFLFKDHLGSIFAVVNANTGQTVQSLTYNDRGQVASDSNPGFQPFGYAGGYYDFQTGLVRFGARDYDPQVGRWTAKDPIKFEGGTSNLYEYSKNNPINYNDPSGEFPKSIDEVGECIWGNPKGLEQSFRINIENNQRDINNLRMQIARAKMSCLDTSGLEKQVNFLEKMNAHLRKQLNELLDKCSGFYRGGKQKI